MNLPAWQATVVALTLPFMFGAVFTWLLCWRLVRGEQWYTPHADHAYQLLIRMGWSHRKVLLAWIALNGLLVGPAAGLVIWKPQVDSGAAAVMAVILAGVWYVVHFVVAKERVTT